MFHSQKWVAQLNATPGSKAIALETEHWLMLGKPTEFVAVVGERLEV